MQKIRRKYEENRLFDCHVRGTICSLNEKRPWLNGITLEGNASKRQRVYEVKNDNVAPLLLYTGPTLVDSRILCRMRAVRIVSDGMPVNTSRRED